MAEPNVDVAIAHLNSAATYVALAVGKLTNSGGADPKAAAEQAADARASLNRAIEALGATRLLKVTPDDEPKAIGSVAIGAQVDLLAERLLGRHVPSRAKKQDEDDRRRYELTLAAVQRGTDAERAASEAARAVAALRQKREADAKAAGAVEGALG